MSIKKEISSFKSMINSYKLTNLIFTSNNLGIFNCLTETPKSLDQISKELKFLSARLEPLLNGLVFHKIVSKNKHGYYLQEYKDVLLKDSKFNQTGYINFAQTIMEKYRNLEGIVKDNSSSIANFRKLTDQDANIFAQGMHANAIPQAEYIADNYDFQNHNILDIGAGAGTYLITVAKKYNKVTGKMIDLEQVSKIQTINIENEHLENRLISIPCDYNDNFPKEYYDDVFLFAVVHQESEENVKKLLDNIYSKLKPDGRLFLTSFFLNDDKISPEFSVQFAIEMLLNTDSGKVYTHGEIKKLLKESNFSNILRIDEIPSPATLYIATK